MLTAMLPSSAWQRMKRSPKTRVSSLTILNANAFSYHSAVLRGSGAFRWMWLIRNAMTISSRDDELAAGERLPPLAGQRHVGRQRQQAGRAHDQCHRAGGAVV